MGFNNLNSRKVKEIYFSESDYILCENIKDREFTLESTYHGDRDEVWIVEKNEDGREVARHNTRLIQSIVWC